MVAPPTSSPVVLHAGCLLGHGGQVHLGFVPVGEAQELLDDVVGHLLHELQRLHVVAASGEDLVQPGQVLVEAAAHAAHGAAHLDRDTHLASGFAASLVTTSYNPPYRRQKDKQRLGPGVRC